jgi:tetratricopeptide (TPR) repeat protein
MVVVMTNRDRAPLRRAPIVLAVLLAFLQAFVGAAYAQGGGKDDEARVLFQAAQMAFTDGRYEDALEYFQKSYELSGRAALLFNIGTTADRLRMEERALAAFQQYLVDLPEADNRREVESRIRIIERAPEERREREAMEARLAAEAEPEPDDPQVELVAGNADPQPAEKKRLIKKPWFWAVLGVAAVGIVVVGAASASGGDGGFKALEPGSDGNVIYTLSFGK